MIRRTPGGIEYQVPEREDFAAVFEAATPYEMFLYPLARVIVRLEELLEAEERNREHALEMNRANQDMLTGQKAIIDAAEVKIDELAERLFIADPPRADATNPHPGEASA